MDLTSELVDMARAAGASLTGIAPAGRFDGAPRGHHPRELLPDAQSVLSFGIRILDRVLKWPELLQGPPSIPEEMRLEALFNSVITAAPLTPSPLMHTKTCLGADCRICVDECPAGAFSLLPEASSDRVWLDPVSRTDWSVCRKSQAVSACMGRCFRVCPTGRGNSNAGV